MYKLLLLFSVCTLLSSAYMIDQHNYFYINSSFSRETTSLSMCFHFNQPATITFDSHLLDPKGTIILAEISDQNSIKFTPPFDPESVGYNNYDSEEYWVGIKVSHDDNNKQNTFQKLKMTIKIGEKEYLYVFLSPLFKLMMNAFQVSPVNTLYSYSNWLLISYLYREAEVDTYFFEAKGQGNYKLLQQADWGFKREDEKVNYQRHKSKKQSRITLEIRNPTSKQRILLQPQTIPTNSFVLPQEQYNFSIEDLKKYAVPIGIESTEL